MAEKSNELNKTVNCFVLDRNKNSSSFVYAYIFPGNCGAFYTQEPFHKIDCNFNQVFRAMINYFFITKQNVKMYENINIKVFRAELAIVLNILMSFSLYCIKLIE